MLGSDRLEGVTRLYVRFAMSKVLPVRALRYDPARVGNLTDVLAPPYDVISPEEQDALHGLHRDNVVRLILGYQHPSDDPGDNRYTRSAAELARMMSAGAIRQDERPAFYVYDQTFVLADGHEVTRRGVIGRWRISDDGGLLAHERTLDGPKQDRFQLFRACKVVCSQVFTFYSDPQRTVDAVVAEPGVLEPAAACTTPDGVTHRLGLVTHPDAVARISEALSACTQFIADGHHRFETTRNYRDARRAEAPGFTGEEPFNFASVYMANTHQDGLVIQPIQRLLHSIPGFDAGRLLADVAAHCEITPVESDIHAVDRALVASGKVGPSFAMWTAGQWRVIRVRPEAHAAFIRDSGLDAAVASLDVSWLHQQVLAGMLGITKEAQAAKTNIAYRHTLEDVAEALVGHPDRFQAAFLLNPVRVEQIQAVAAVGERMPQKSTFFYPKIISGLVIHPLEERIP